MEKKQEPINPMDFNPDEFALKKDDVLWFLKIVIRYWMRNKKQAIKNIKLIGGLEMMKAGIIFTSEDDFKSIWSMLIAFILEMMYQNQVQKSLSDEESWAKTLKNLKSTFNEKKIEEMLERARR